MFSFENFEQDLDLAGLAHRTKRDYMACIRAFCRFHGRCPAELGQDDLRGWVRHLTERGASPERLRKHFAALRFAYSRTLGRADVVAFLTWPSRAESLPVVLGAPEISRLLAALRSPTYRTFFATLYATGLRLTEACRLETADVDAARGVIHVRNGKGGRPRVAMLSPKLLLLLRAYWSLVRPPAPWLFASSRGGPLSTEVARRALRAAVKASGIAKRVTPHSFRHAFATHMLEAGGNLRVIQAVLGHASIRSTARYTRVSTELIGQARSPIEDLADRDRDPGGD
jgi:integrase/recombinase XerD